MGLLDKLFGGSEGSPTVPSRSTSTAAPPSADERALAQYRYMLQTAPPEAIEQAHAEAFARLTPEQRRQLLQQLTADLPDAERGAAADDPRSLARMATRAEVRQPGAMERTFSGIGGRGGGMAGMMAGSFLSTIAGVVVGSAIAQAFLGHSGPDPDAADTTSDDASSDTASADSAGSDGGDFDGGDFG